VFGIWTRILRKNPRPHPAQCLLLLGQYRGETLGITWNHLNVYKWNLFGNAFTVIDGCQIPLFVDAYVDSRHGHDIVRHLFEHHNIGDEAKNCWSHMHTKVALGMSRRHVMLPS
jgi:hypothetical protein